MINYVTENRVFALSPSGSLLALAKSNQTIETINTLNGEVTTLDVKTAADTDIHFVDENTLAYSNQDNSLVTYDLNLKEVCIVYALSSPAAVIESKGHQLAVSDETKLLLINLDGSLEYELKGCRAAIQAIAYSHNSDHIFATGDKKVHMWDLSMKKPKSSLIATLETNGESLSISYDDRYVTVTEIGKWNVAKVYVYDIESKQQVFHSHNDLPIYTVLGGLFIDGCLALKGVSKLIFVDTATWTVCDEIIDVKGCCTKESDGVIAVSTHEKVRLLTLGDKVLYQTPMINLSPVTYLLSKDQYLYSVSNVDIVKREINGQPISRNKDFFIRDIQSVIETSINGVVWIIMLQGATLLDFETNEELADASFKNKFGSACRTSNNRTIFVSSTTTGCNGCISEYSDDGQKQYQYEKLGLYNVLAVWETEDGVRILGSRFRKWFNPRLQQIGGQEGNAGIYSFAYINSAKDKLLIAEEVDEKVFFKCIKPDFSNESSPSWRVNVDGYSILDWAIPGQLLFLKKTDGSICTLDCNNGDIVNTEIKEPRATSALVINEDQVAFGLDNGMVSIQQLSGDA